MLNDRPLPGAIDDVRPGQLNTSASAERVKIKPKSRIGKLMKQYDQNFLLEQDSAPLFAPRPQQPSGLPPRQPPPPPRGSPRAQNRTVSGVDKGRGDSYRPPRQAPGGDSYRPGPQQQVNNRAEQVTRSGVAYRTDKKKSKQQPKQPKQQQSSGNKQAKSKQPKSQQPTSDRYDLRDGGNTNQVAIGNHRWGLPAGPPTRAEAFMSLGPSHIPRQPPPMMEGPDSRYHVSKRRRR
jgi:hypothetical protein